MSAYERQLLVKYHHAELLGQAHEARLAKAARAASRAPTQRVGMAALSGPLQSILASTTAWWQRRAAARAVTPRPQAPATGRVVLRSTHLR